MTQVTEVREVTEVQEAEKAPTNERPAQLNDTAPEVNPQEAAALEAIRKSLDDLDCMANMVMAKLCDAGTLRQSTTPPPSRPDYEAVIHSVVPEAPVSLTCRVYGCYTRPGGEYRARHTKAEAEQIVAAIIACTPGPVTVTDEIYEYSRWLKVKAQDGDLEFIVFYGPDDLGASQ
jgi:hypothetical protein